MITRGRFGHDEVNISPATICMNMKGDMNTTELKKLFKNSYLTIYPDTSDDPGKRVLCQIGLGPGSKGP